VGESNEGRPHLVPDRLAKTTSAQHLIGHGILLLLDDIDAPESILITKAWQGMGLHQNDTS
jgi:hypothetical protein